MPMIRIKVLSVGKTKELWLEQAITEYLERLRSMVTFSFVWAKDDRQLIALADKESLLLGLDPAGTLMSSEKFTSFFAEQIIEGGARASFVIGGPLGLPMVLREKIPLISLSPMTFTHQMTRLILTEQIYRAVEILKGSPYHKA
jgi:23S rRNA (pseudouridine1915-N3)-methyltransferase